MSEWKEYKLGDVAEVKYGKAHQSLADGKIPAYGSGGLMRYVERALYEDESILIPRKGTLNNVMYKSEPFWTVDTMFYTRLNKQIIVPKYLFYQLSTIDFANMNVGSAVPSMTVSVLNEIEITVPPLPEQTAIATVLSRLDNKIDLLHRQSATLEKMAETLFRQWFVEEAKEEWEVVKMESLISIGSGKGLKKESFIDNGLYPILGANGEIGRSNEYLFDEKLIYTGRVGTLGNIFRIENEKVWLSDNTLVIKPVEYFNFIYLILKTSRLEDYNVGSTQPLIRQSDIKEIEVALPSKDKLLEFESLTDKIFKKIKSNQTQIRTLTALRDTLLPKLMSGEVRVEM